MNIELRSYCSGGHPCIQHANGTLPHNLRDLRNDVIFSVKYSFEGKHRVVYPSKSKSDFLSQ